MVPHGRASLVFELLTFNNVDGTVKGGLLHVDPFYSINIYHVHPWPNLSKFSTFPIVPAEECKVGKGNEG